MSRRIKLAAASCALGIGMTAIAQAAEPQLGLVAQPADRFERSIETRKLELRRGIDDVRARIEKAESAERDPGLAGGVSQGTLEAIAACESGGDPTAVNPAGYYGKYQFDAGTWASVGGAGNPAEASEAEQDYRASLLYSQAGSSPWPLCGA